MTESKVVYYPYDDARECYDCSFNKDGFCVYFGEDIEEANLHDCPVKEPLQGD